jgi:hypothetical protein
MKTTKTAGRQTDAARISAARLIRLTRQNEKLAIEVQRLRGEVGPIEVHRQEVLKANGVVRQQILAVPYRLGPQLATTTDPQQCGKLLEDALVQCLNDLAYARQVPPSVCPTCHREMKKGEEK